MAHNRAHAERVSASFDLGMQGVVDLQTWPRDLLALYSADNLDRFIDQAFSTLQRIVPCAYVSAFYQRAGDAFLKERDSRGRRWGRAFMRRYVALTAAIPLVRANPGAKILATRFGMPGSDDELRRTAFYQDVMQRQGWRHGAALCFWAHPPTSFPVVVLALYRTEDQPDFSDHDLAHLEDVHPFLAPAVTRFHERSVADAVSEGVASALRHVAQGIVVLDGELRVVRSNLSGRRSCAEWTRPSESMPSPVRHRDATVPDCLLRVCEDLRQALPALIRQGGDCRAQRRRYVAHPHARDRLASVTIICMASAIAEPTFVIEFGDTAGSVEHAEGAAEHIGTHAILMRLTQAEGDVAVAVSKGLSNEEVAEALGKSIHAVKFLLHRAYTKLGVPNRSRLSLLLNRDAGSGLHHAAAPS